MSNVSAVKRIVTWVACGLFVAIHALLLPGLAVLPAWLALLLWGFTLPVLLVLLLRYNRALAQWRAVLLIWLAYSGLRLFYVASQGIATPFIRGNLGTFAMMLAVDAMLAGWFAIVALAVRRDVSVAYVVICFAVGAVLLRAAVRAAGGVLNFMTSQAPGAAAAHFTLAEPLLMVFSCMSTLGFLTFLPHLLWLGIRELRGR